MRSKVVEIKSSPNQGIHSLNFMLIPHVRIIISFYIHLVCILSGKQHHAIGSDLFKSILIDEFLF